MNDADFVKTYKEALRCLIAGSDMICPGFHYTDLICRECVHRMGVDLDRPYYDRIPCPCQSLCKKEVKRRARELVWDEKSGVV